jgi:hypothetical protein
MAKPDNLKVVPKTKGTKAPVDKKIDSIAHDAAKKASKTEQKYEQKQGIFTK